MQILGFVLLLGGVWVAYQVWDDPVQGPFLRPLCGLAVVAGFYMFFEAIKRAIIDAVRHPHQDETPPEPQKRGDQ